MTHDRSWQIIKLRTHLSQGKSELEDQVLPLAGRIKSVVVSPSPCSKKRNSEENKLLPMENVSFLKRTSLYAHFVKYTPQNI